MNARQGFSVALKHVKFTTIARHCRLKHSATFRPEISQSSKLTDIGTRSVFSEDHDIFRSSVRKFIKEEIVPEYDRWVEAGQVPQEIWRRAGSLGMLGIDTPAEYGGHGGDFLSAAIVPEEQWYANCSAPTFSLQSHLVLPYFVKHGCPEQRQQYIPRLIAGECVGCIAMTEPHAGSDLQGIKTYAYKDGNDWILNGSKVFITHGIVADVCIVLAVTDKNASSPAHGMTLFVVDTDTPGFNRGRKLKKLGVRAEDTAELFFEDIRLPKAAILREENKGFYHIMGELSLERLLIGLRTQAHAEWMFEETRDYVKQRKAFGKTISDLQTVQHTLAEMKTEICIGRAFTDRCLKIYNDTGSLDVSMASMLKYWSSELENRVATSCLQLHGGWGYMMEYPIARAFLDARINPIWGGTNEIMKELIARPICRK